MNHGLRGRLQLRPAEYTLLKQSVEQLATVGRNLNQIARAMNQGERGAGPGRTEVLTKVAEGLRDHFKGLLDANNRSWSAGHGKTAH